MNQMSEYRPKAKLSGGKDWRNKELLKDYIENDPYIQPNKILDAIANQGNENQSADYDQLLKLSLTGKFSLSKLCIAANGKE